MPMFSRTHASSPRHLGAFEFERGVQAPMRRAWLASLGEAEDGSPLINEVFTQDEVRDGTPGAGQAIHFVQAPSTLLHRARERKYNGSPLMRVISRVFPEVRQISAEFYVGTLGKLARREPLAELLRRGLNLTAVQFNTINMASGLGGVVTGAAAAVFEFASDVRVGNWLPRLDVSGVVHVRPGLIQRRRGAHVEHVSLRAERSYPGAMLEMLKVIPDGVAVESAAGTELIAVGREVDPFEIELALSAETREGVADAVGHLRRHLSERGIEVRTIAMHAHDRVLPAAPTAPPGSAL